MFETSMSRPDSKLTHAGNSFLTSKLLGDIYIPLDRAEHCSAWAAGARVKLWKTSSKLPNLLSTPPRNLSIPIWVLILQRKQLLVLRTETTSRHSMQETAQGKLFPGERSWVQCTHATLEYRKYRRGDTGLNSNATQEKNMKAHRRASEL
jgi:hypothetical protein